MTTNEITELAEKMPTTYLRAFFSEKEIPIVAWDLTAENGTVHHISNVVVVERIAQTQGVESKMIEDTLRRLDFAAGDVNGFLKHLAGALINE